MARQPIDTLRSYFLQGDVPTQGQFNDLIDGFDVKKLVKNQKMALKKAKVPARD